MGKISNTTNIARIANAVQCQSFLSGNYNCNVMFSIVKNVNNFRTSLGLKVFSKCICRCLFVGWIMFSHHSCFLITPTQVSRRSLCVPKSK